MPHGSDLTPSAQAGSWHLAPAAREHLAKHLDVDAFEEVLRDMAPTDRDEIVQSFNIVPVPNSAGGTTMMPVLAAGNAVRMPVSSTDPAKQALLERMWAPYWEQLPDSEFDSHQAPFPGREIARARRAERRARVTEDKR